MKDDATGEVEAKDQRKRLSVMKRKGRKAVAVKARKLEKLVVSYEHPDALEPNPWNPNRQSEQDFELLLRSMEEDGFTQPVVALREGKVIVDGEHRWRAARHLGLDEIPVVYTDMTEEQARIATLRHNRARGSEDVNLAAELLRDLRELGALDQAQEALMLDDTELTRLLDDVPAPDSLAGEEFGSAWVPDANAKGAEEAGISDADAGVTISEQAGEDGGTQALAATTKAQEDIRERERRIAAAKTEEERQAAVKEANVYRLSLIFSGDEATIVKRALGSRAAERLVELCRAAVEEEPKTQPPDA